MEHYNFNIMNRRSFLNRSLKTSFAVALSTLVDIPLVVRRALAEQGIGLNGKKLMFIWLRGANDGLNAVIPIQDPSYATSRPTLAVAKDPALNYASTGPCHFPINNLSDAPTYGYGFGLRLGNGFAALHPSLKFLAPVYNAGDLALIHRVAYPRQSRSHFDSQRYWENGNPNNNLSQDGVLYRAILESGLANTSPLTGVSFQSSLPLLLRGSEAAMTNLSDPLRYDLLGIPNNAQGQSKADAFLARANGYPFPDKKSRDLLRLQFENMSNTLDIFADIGFTDADNTFRDDEITDNDTEWAAANGNEGYYLFPTTNLKNGGWRRPDGSNQANKYVIPTGQQSFFERIKAAALVLNKTDAFVAGTEFGGFDTHSQQGQLTGTHPDLSRTYAWAIYALRKYFTRYADKCDWNNLVVITLTEFGRTTIENADLGTDHAEGGVVFVAGGSVRGYNKGGSPTGVFNCGPDTPSQLAIDPIPWVQGPGPNGAMFRASGRYLGRTTDYRSVLGEVIRKHLGATSAQIARILPGYGVSGEKLEGGGTSSVDGVQIRGEVGIL